MADSMPSTSQLESQSSGSDSCPVRNNLGSKSRIPHNDKLSLTVQECSSTSFSEVYLSQSVMTQHLFWNGDSKVLLGKDGFRTACTLFTDPAPNEDDALPDDRIKINPLIRAKLGVAVRDSVTILKEEKIPHGITVCVRPFEECPGDLESVNLLEAYLRPYFKDAFRPVHRGDVFHITRSGKQIKFKITNVDPSPFCTVGPGTSIDIRGRSFKSDESKNIKTKFLSAHIKVEPGLEPEVTFLKAVPASALATVALQNSETDDTELEQNGNRCGSSSSSKHIVTVNLSENTARSSCQLKGIADPLKRKHSGEMAQATTKSRKSEAETIAPVSVTTTNDDDDDPGCESQGSSVGGGRGLISSSFAENAVSISQKDEDDSDSPAAASENWSSPAAAAASRNSASVSTPTTSNHGDWGPPGGYGREGEPGGGSQFRYSRRQNQNSFDSNNARWNNKIGRGGRGLAGMGRRGLYSTPFVSAYHGTNRGGGYSGGFGLPNIDNWPRGQGACGYGRRGGTRDFRSMGGITRGGNGNRGEKGFRGGRGLFQNRGNNNTYGFGASPRPQTAISNNTNSQCKIQSAQKETYKVKPKPFELPDFSQPPPNLTELRVGSWLEKSNDSEHGIIHDPPAVDMHENRNSEPSLTEEELSAQHELARSLFIEAQFSDAMSGFKIVLDKRTELLGHHHVDTLRSHFFVGRCLFKQKKVPEAKNILEHVLKIQKLVLSADNDNIEDTELAVARCFDKLENYKEAETLYQLLYTKRNKRLGHSHKDTLITQFNLAYALDMQNKLNDAMKWYGTFVALWDQYLGPGNESVVYARERIKCILTNSV